MAALPAVYVDMGEGKSSGLGLPALPDGGGYRAADIGSAGMIRFSR